MKLACLLFGCKWNTGMRFISGKEHLLMQHCDRCCSSRTVSE
jgi:hypothetical protein